MKIKNEMRKEHILENVKSVLCVAIILAISLGIAIGLYFLCDGPQSKIRTKAEFFTYFIEQRDITSEKYSQEDVKNCKDGTVQAEIMVEHGYLTKKDAFGDLDELVTKEFVIVTLTNYAIEFADVKIGNPDVFADKDKLMYPQIVANAYESGFFSLNYGEYVCPDNNMSYKDIKKIMDKIDSQETEKEYLSNMNMSEISE